MFNEFPRKAYYSDTVGIIGETVVS